MKILNKLEEVFIGTSLLLTCIVLLINVVLRYLFKTGIPWAEELIKYLMIWIAFVGASVALREGKHVSIDFIQDFLSEKANRGLRILISVITFGLTSTITYFGIQAIVFIQGTNQLSPALQVPMWIPYMAIPIGFGLMTIRALQAIFKVIKAGN